MIYIKLFFEFFKVGLFSIGGGMATIPFLIDLSEKTNWFSTSELADMVAVSESTPGPIGINMATYVGFHISGFFGGMIATLGLVFPSVVIIIVIYYLLNHFDKYESVQTVLKFLRASVIGLISYAFIQMIKICLFNEKTFQIVPLVLFIIFCILILTIKKIHPILWIILGAVTGLLFL